MRSRIPSLWLITAFAVTASSSAVPAPLTAQARYRIIARYAIGGNEAGYDYIRVDPMMRRLYVAHSTRVEILDADSGRKIGAVAGLHGVHGIAIVPSVGKGYASDGLDGAVTVFDLESLKILGRIKSTGVMPDAIAYDRESRRVFAVNGKSGDITVIDPKNDAVVGTVRVGGGKLEEIGFDGHGRALVNDETNHEIHVFDTHGLRPLATWPLAPCEEPTGIAVDRAHHRVFCACGNGKLIALDTADGRRVATLPIGLHPDGAAFDPATQRIFASSWAGTLSVIHESSPDRYESVQTVATERGARTLALDEKTGRLFLPTARFGKARAGGGRAPLVPGTFVVLVVGE